MSIWADIHRRAKGVQERKEDKSFKEDKKVDETNLWNDWSSNYAKPIEKDWEDLKEDYSRYSNPWKYRNMINRDMWK